MPINRADLLKDLKKWVTKFEADLREQCKEVPELDARLKSQYQAAKDAERTAFAYSVWRDAELTQSAVGWVLSCVFVRFLEDNDLLEKPFISGVGENRELAGELRAAYFNERRTDSDSDYLQHAIREVGKLPGMADLMDTRHNALWNAAISGDAAKEFIEFWRRIDPASGALAHDFTDPDWDTRFLGDLYQDLSESARKKFALLQTPDFVEEFILDRTLNPAIDTFGLKVVRMIDPTCGSGHFLLGGFARLLRRWQKERPDLSERELATKALDGVYGVDINPFAVAIARFRLLFAAWKVCGVKQLRSAPDFKVNLAVGDSLLHGRRFDEDRYFDTEDVFRDEIAHFFDVEDSAELHRILGQQYHAVVGNPPYIQASDAAANRLYRDRYKSCAGKFSLAVPFMERFFDLAVNPSDKASTLTGYTGQITANSFMKRKFGNVLIETYVPKWDITHIIDSSWAYIPGMGTSTVIIFGRNRKPTSPNVRLLEGIKGEPSTPRNPRLAKVWTDLLEQVDLAKSESEYFVTSSPPRKVIEKHPWILSELARSLSDQNDKKLGVGNGVGSIGVVTLEDDAFVLGEAINRICGAESRRLVEGDSVRDWGEPEGRPILFPYDKTSSPSATDSLTQALWGARTTLRNRVWFRKTQDQRGLEWWEYGFLSKDIAFAPRVISFAFVSTHNNYVLDRGGKVFNRSAPVIKLPIDSTEADHMQLLGTLNSAVACFWMKQVFYPKGGDHVGQEGARVRKTLWDERYEFDGTKLKQFPLSDVAPLNLPCSIEALAQELSKHSPEALAIRDDVGSVALAEADLRSTLVRACMISLQEELDWQCYRHYGLIDTADDLEWPEDRLDDLPPLTLGERAFEIRMARQMAAGELETTWFERHKHAGSKPITELPAAWPDDYRALVERRLAFIESNKNINLIERPEYKRRWNTEPWDKRQQAALQKWLLTRLEAYFADSDRMVDGADEATKADKLKHLAPIRARFAGGGDPKLVSVRQLAAAAETDSAWMEAAAVYAGREDFKVAELVEKLVLAECVPALPAQRYKPTGLRKRIEWESTWESQRAEDKVEAEVRKANPDEGEDQLKPKIRQAQQEQVGDIPVPPKYAGKDFAKPTYWKLRGKLDVPKERWVFYPGAEGGIDESPVIAWAGWDHAQQAKALAGFYHQAKETWAWDKPRLTPLLAALKELLPWLHQWHNEIDPTYNDRLSTIYQNFYETERHALQLTDEDVEEIRLGTD